MRRHFWGLIIVSVISYWTIKPLLQTGYFTMHDDTQVARVIVMGKAIRNGQFPVRWVSELGYGYGYPLYNFYGPLPYYVAGGLYAAGLDAVAATKIMMATGMILSAICMYALAQLLFGRLAGVLAAVLYAYAPYHAVQLYVRGAVGELWAYAFLPIFLLGISLISRSARSKDGVWIGGLGLAAIILSHTIMGYVTVVFYVIGLALYCLTLLFQKRFHFSYFDYAQYRLFTFHLLLITIGLGLSAFFWLPAISEMGYTNVASQIGATANVNDHFVCLPQLWNSPWGYGGSAPGCIDGMSFKIGKLHILLALLGVGLAVRTTRLFIIIGIVSTFMVLGISRGIWEFIPGLRYVQYPWRLLTGVALTTSLLGSSVLYPIGHRWIKVGILALLSVITLGLNVKLFRPQISYDKPARFFESKEELSWRVSKVSDEYLPPSFSAPRNPDATAQEILSSDVNRGLVVETEIDTETYVKLHVQAQTPIDVILRRAYFPGWQYWINGVRQNVRVESGLPMVTVPTGSSVVEMRLGNTPVRIIGNILSLFVLVWFLKTYGKTSFA